MTNEQVENRTLSEQVYEFLRSEILSERYAPGSDLSDAAVAQILGISRGPVREAMGRLWAEGLVEIRPRRGAIVATLSKREFEEAYQVRGALEILAVQQATRQPNTLALEAIEEIVNQMEECMTSGNEDRFFGLNTVFHREICRLSNNEILVDLYDSLIARMARYSHRAATVRGDLASSYQEHRAILDAIKRNDVQAAARFVEEHISVFVQLVQALSETEWEALSAS